MILKNKTPIYIIIISLLVAFYADIRAMNWMFIYGNSSGGSDTGMLGLLYPVVIAMIAIVSVLFWKGKRSISLVLAFFLIYICLFYYITNNLIGPPRTPITLVMGFVLGALAIPSLAVIDAKWFLRALMFFPSFAIFRLDQVFAPIKDWEIMMAMDTSYAFLVPIVGAIVYMFLYLPQDDKKTKILMIPLCVVNIVFLWQLFLHGSRGPLLSILLLIVFLYVVRKNRNDIGVNIVRGKFSVILISFVIISFTYIAFLQSIIDILSGFNIDSYSLSKMIDLNKEGDISNGRNYLNQMTINGIMENPLFGNGFDRYDANTRGLYPHNFILQLLYDGGLLYFCVIMFPVIKGTINKYKNCTYDEFSILTLLLFSSVPGALLSQNLYENSILWLFFGFAIASVGFVDRPKCLLK